MISHNDIAISIKADYAKAIFDGSKYFEFRHVRPKDTIDKMFIHVCGEDPSKIQGMAIVEDVITGSVAEIWDRCKDGAGITIVDFYDYFAGRRSATAYKLADAKRFESPIDLADLNIKHIPQSFTYVRRRS